MIFRNMEALGLMDVRRVIKVGDTVSDIREGKNAGVLSAGIVTGSSEMGLSLEEFEALSPEETRYLRVPQNGRKIPGCGSGPGIPHTE